MTARDGHLGELAAALVDGALPGDTRDHALAHVAGCTRCRIEVDEQRRLKDRLRRLADPDLPAGLSQRLQDLSATAGALAAGAAPALPDTHSRPRLPRARAARQVRRPRRAGSSPGPAAPPKRSRGRSSRRVAGGVTALAMGVVVVVVALGPLRDQAPAISPPVVRYTVEHAQVTGGFPGADPAAGAVMTASADR